MASADTTTRVLEARRIRGIQTAVVIALVVVVMRATPWTRSFPVFPLIENYAYDVLFDHSRPERPEDIVIIEIDDKSLTELGRFPWHRDEYASLLDGPLSEAGVVAFDILFPEADEHRRAPEVTAVARGDVDHIEPTADDMFAEAMRAHGRVVLAAHWRQGGAPDKETLALLRRFGYPHARGRLARGKRGEVLCLPAPKLAAAAAAVGYVDIDPDTDGVYRRFRPLMTGPESLIFPHFATAVAALANGASGEQIAGGVRENQVGVARPDGLFAPIDHGGTTLINYCGPTGTVRRVSFVDVMRDEGAREKLRDKIVIVGATAPGLYDIRPAPYRRSNRLFFGVETNANIVDTLLHRQPLWDVSGSYAWGIFALVLGLLVGLAVWNTGEVVATSLSMGLLVLVAAPSFFVAFSLWHQWIPYGAILLATALPLAVCLPLRLTEERRLIQRQFDVYVSPDVLKELMSAPDLIRESRRRPVTLLFADVRGSTSLSEKIPPEVWVAQLNEYLTQMSLAIFSFDGYLDKFMGDGIMAVWNAFGTQPDDHAELAVRAGRQMLVRLELLNKKWEQMEDRTPFAIGIGIHSGEAVMGNVGSDDRAQFTAIGDVVNTASRIEGMCKEFNSEFIISEDTGRLVEGMFALRELGKAQVRGRSAGIGVLEVAGRPVEATQKGDA